MANQLILDRALDQNGYIAPGAKATIYADGTSTLITVYSDVAGTIAATNPIVADGNGYWPQRYVTEDAKAVVTDADDVALYTLDPAPTAQGSGAAASAVSFTPTLDLPQTNVQAAIEAAATLAVSGFAAFGLGITGNATLLANLDATGTGAGLYRFDGTTTGTYPTGVAAADTGAVELWRQAGATAMMELHHATSNRAFRRRLTSSTWGAWREVINVNQATAEGDIPYRGASDWVRLPKGTAGQALVMNSGATAPEWAASGLIPISDQLVSGAAVANLNFTAFNNAIYRYYRFVFDDVAATTDAVTFQVLFSTNGGSSYDNGGGNYAHAGIGASGGSPFSAGTGSDTVVNLTVVGDVGNAAGENGVTGTLTLFHAGDATKRTRVRGELSYDNSGGNTQVWSMTGRRLTEQDTDAVRFQFSAGNIAIGSRIRMYGFN